MQRLRFTDPGLALGLARKLAKLGFVVIWYSSDPYVLKYRQLKGQSDPKDIRWQVNEYVDWINHGTIDTRDTDKFEIIQGAGKKET